MRSVLHILQSLTTSLDGGIPDTHVPRSRELFGANVLTPLPRQPLWRKFLEKFDEPIIKILLVAALLSMVVELFRFERAHGGWALAFLTVLVAGAYLLRQAQWLPTLLFAAALVLFAAGVSVGHVLVEGLAVMIAVVLATGVAFASEYKSDREFEMLNSRKDSLQAKLLRGGRFCSVPLEEVVVGDLVLLEMGDEVPADGLLVKATELYVDQSLMTGESEPVRKHAGPIDDLAAGPDQPGCLYRGTQAVDGVGQMMVTEVGDDTYLGQIARRLALDGQEESLARTATSTMEERVERKLTIAKDLTPLQEKLQHLAGVISRVGYIAAALIFLAQVVRGIAMGEVYWPRDGAQLIDVLGELLSYFVTMVIIIVVAVPEGLPMSVTVSLALAMRKMTRANSLVRQLAACETIGSATVICSDKTGTLTQNRMQVDLVSLDEVTQRRGEASWARNGKPMDWLALGAAVNSTANLEEKEGKLVTVGNSTEGALLHWLREFGLDHAKLRLRFPSLYQLHFSSERKRMTTVIRHGSGLVTLVKGAPEWVLDHCRYYQTSDDSPQLLTTEKKDRFRGNLRGAARLAMRTLAFAYAPLPEDTPIDEEGLHARRDSLEAGLTWVGFVAIRDPLRGDVKGALAECRQAGIQVKMITGDNVETARAIGYEIGLIESAEEPIDVPGAAVLTSPRFEELSDQELAQQLPRLRILARARPLDKYRMVRLLQERGEVVAVTGDGTNDAPALKKADVGLAMGIAGTEVAKEASKIVLLDDAFSTIVSAVHWGRSLYENIQRFIQFQLTINVSALAITFLGILLFNVKTPFTVLQLLWINVIMDTLASVALCSEPPRAGVMDVPPRRRDESILTRRMLQNIFLTAAFFVVVMLALLVLMKGAPDTPGFLAGNGPWSVEVAGNRLALDGGALEHREGKWRVKDDVSDPTLRGKEADVDFTVYQVSLFFTIYVFFQVWNQINCRSLTPETSGLHGLFRNPTFLLIALGVAAGQVVIISVGGPVFKVQPLDALSWVGVIVFTSSVLVFAEIVRRVRLRWR